MDSSFRRLRTRILGAFAGILSLTAVSVAWAQTPGGTLVILTHPEPTTLTNALTSAATPTEVGSKIYDGLLEYDMDMKPVPSLAESWDVSEDGQTITFHLRQGVKWHDGKDFTSADVKFSLLEVVKVNHPRGNGNLGPVNAIDTPDDHTVIFHLDHPYPPLFRGLSSAEAPIVPKHIYEGTDFRNNPANNAPIGTGPYKFASWDRGTSITLEKNPDYWREGRPFVDRLIYRFIADGATRSAAMENGEAHVATFGTIVPAELSRLTQLDHLEVVQGGYEMLAPMLLLELNVKKKPLDDKRVRQAISYAIDRNFIAENIFYGYGKPAVGPVSSVFQPAGIFTTEGIVDYMAEDRLEKAARLLDEAGYPAGSDGTRFEITHDVGPYGDDYRRLGEYLRQALGKVGIKVTLRNEDWATWLRRIYTDYDYEINSGWFSGMGDPTLGVQRQFVSANIKSGVGFSNAAQYSDPENDQLWADVAKENDPAKRAELFARIQRKLVEDSPNIWLMEMQMVPLINTKVKNLITSPLGMRSPLYEVSLEQ